MNEELIEEQPKPKHPGGRPPKPKNIHDLWEKEQMAQLELAARIRHFTEAQLDALEEEVKQIAGVKARLDVFKVVTSANTEFQKQTRAVMADAQKKPEDTDNKTFDLEAFLKEQQ